MKHLLILALFVPLTTSAQTAPQKHKVESCEGKIAAARAEGFLTALRDYTITLGAKERPLPLEIMDENIAGAESYKFAAAEVIRTQFGDRFEVDPKAELVLYLGGTNLAQGSTYDSGTQYLDVYLLLFTRLPLRAGDETRSITVRVILAHEGNLVTNFTADHRAQVVRELVYSVLDKFSKNWAAASQ